MLPMRITFFVTLLYFISITAFAQTQNEDSIKVIKPFDSFIIKNTAYLTDSSNAFKYSEYIWSDKRTISEVMDKRPGYFVFDFFGLGGRNAITNSSILPYFISAFRDGIQVNDIVYGGFDVEIFSINEIEAVEEISATRSLLYGINSFGRSFNVITKDYFTPLPFSQLRYSQDRSNSLFADVFYSQAFSKKFGLQFGITKHSLDGRFENSAFDTWKTRTRLTFNLSDRINLKANFYYNYIERGLNGGVDPSVRDIDSLLSGDAHVINKSNFEEAEHIYYDVNFFGKLFKNDRSISKVNFYSRNILNKNLLNISDSNSIDENNFYHLLSYGLISEQNIYFNHGKNIQSNLILGADFQSNLISKSDETLTILSIKSAYEFNYKPITLTAIYRYDLANGESLSNFGVEGKLYFKIKDDFELTFTGGIKKSEYELLRIFNYKVPRTTIHKNDWYFSEKGMNIKYKDFIVGVYANQYSNEPKPLGVNSYYVSFSFNPEWLSFNLNYNFNSSSLFPKNYLKGNIAYKSSLFENNLILHSGFDFKYYNITNVVGYDYKFNFYFETDAPFPQPNQFLADFYIGARIGNANINLTVANIFNSLVYNAYIYPLDNRGGLLNAISRFTIVWDFLN